MPTIEWTDLEQTYKAAGSSESEPNMAYMSIGAYHAIVEYFSPKKPDFWETDDFISWGRKLYQEARRPKNSTLRQFLGTTRWERRGR